MEGVDAKSETAHEFAGCKRREYANMRIGSGSAGQISRARRDALAVSADEEIQGLCSTLCRSSYDGEWSHAETSRHDSTRDGFHPRAQDYRASASQKMVSTINLEKVPRNPLDRHSRI